MKVVILTGFVLFFGTLCSAQDFVSNALLFSRTQPSGSARMLGIGGSHSALGGDYSSAFVNPAGLGFFNKSEISVSPAITSLNSTSTYYGTTTPKESRSALSLPGLGIVLHSPSYRDKGFLGGTFAITLTRMNDFHQDFRYRANNNQNSIIDFFIEDAGRIDPDDLLIDSRGVPGDYFYSLTALAYNNYLIEENYDENNQILGYGTVLNFNRVRQQELSQRKGGMTQWSLSYGANFDDMIYLGASLGIASIRYEQTQTFREDDFRYNENAPAALNSFDVSETLKISGTGVNLTLGAIVRPVDFLQVGVSFVTPTFYGLTDRYYARIDSEWANFEYFQGEFLNNIFQEFPEDQLYEYNITTPSRLRAGLAFIQKFGFISFDTEWVNYKKAKYSSEIPGEFSGENSAIGNTYSSVLNHTLGMEFRHDIFRLRLGGNIMSDPYKEKANVDRSVKSVSGGAGVRFTKFYADFGVNHSWTEARRIPYYTLVGDADPLATMDLRSTRFQLTFGYTF